VAAVPLKIGQGFPGLVYLSTLSYLPAEQRPTGVRDQIRQTFFSDLLAPHEVAHQWWGNLVTADDYQDAWLMEALSNYSALLYLEKRSGPRAVDTILEHYRDHLLKKTDEGKTVESAGPIVWGTRIERSETGLAAARTIIYEKGPWVLHMLRLRMGDDRFLRMLKELCSRYAYKSLSTEGFRALAEEFMTGKSSLESFFESWVYGTGIPVLKVSSSVRGKPPAMRVAVMVTQSGVDDDFSVEVPVEIQFNSGPPVVKWIRTASEPVSVTVPVKRTPVRVVAPQTGVLAKR